MAARQGAGGGIAHASGFDIGFFADAAGTMRLAHEVEVYRSDANMGTLVAWVKVPSLSAASELFVRYGDPAVTTSQENAAAVWSNGFSAVWHLSGLGDSTANANAGTNSGSTGMAGRIGDGRSFDGNNGHVDVGSGTSIDNLFTGGGTVEAWLRATGWGEGNFGRIIDKGDMSSDVSGWSLCMDPGALRFLHASTMGAVQRGSWRTAADSIALNTWTHVAVVYDKGSTSNDPSIYINGAPVTASLEAAPGGTMVSDSSYSARLGNRMAVDRTFDGVLDEVRLSTTPRSTGWITTSFRNQSDPAVFYTVGPEL